MRDRERVVVAEARQHGHERAHGLDAAGQVLRPAGLGCGLRLGQQQRAGLNLVDGGAGVGPAGFDDRKRAGIAERIDRIGGRIFGNDHDGTQQCHGDTRVRGRNTRDATQSLLMPGQRRAQAAGGCLI
jgi:hypothetical protein